MHTYPEGVPTVLDVLGFVPGAQSRQRFEYSLERPPKRRHTKNSYLSRREVDARIEPYIADLRAGAPDAWVAKQSDLTAWQVKAARHRLHIMRPPGPQAGWRRWMAVSALGTSPIPMPTRSVVGGDWQVPQYVLRQPLDYRALVRVVRAATEAGMSPGTIASGLGLRARDVEHAQALGDRL